MRPIIYHMPNIQPEAQRIIADIRALKIQGATKIAGSGVKCIEITARKSAAKNRGAFFSELQFLSERLSNARPTEPALRNAIKSVLLRVQIYEDFDTIKKYTIQVCTNYIKELKTMINKIADIGSNQIKDSEKILTHCHSEHVIAILKAAKKQGKAFEVYVTETRPKYQGIITAKKLLNSGIKVTYCIDAAIGYIMTDVTKVLVGCDAILADGSIVNKRGTFPIAVTANKFGVPVVVAGGTYKFDAQTILGQPEPVEHRDPSEVINPRTLPKAQILNPAFDITPAEYVHSLVTEKGITKPEWVRELAEI
jgi:ribose 1,5-bisphosphate isomerase